jgi:hypothetical protein
MERRMPVIRTVTFGNAESGRDSDLVLVESVTKIMTD